MCQQLISGPHKHINKKDKQPSTLTPADSLQLVNQPSLLVFELRNSAAESEEQSDMGGRENITELNSIQKKCLFKKTENR